MSSAIDQIIKWAHGLPSWQADAVRRLLEQAELTSEDRDEIYQMLKVEAGLDSECKQGVPPTMGVFSGTATGAKHLTLERILSINHVNAIKNGSSIPFGLEGLTVVYGQNGSGKSSYGRILKRACRARDTKEPIHPNAFDANEVGPATATIRITEGSQTGIELAWVDGQPSDERLARVSFFDSKCARVIVDENNEAQYIPYGCEIFDSLVELIKTFRQRLTTARPAPVEPKSAGVLPGSPSHVFLQQLTRHTTAQAISAATEWTEPDEHNLSTIVARISQSQTKQSLDKAQRLRSTAARIKKLVHAIEDCSETLSSIASGKLTKHLDELAAAEKAASIAAQFNLSQEPLTSGNSNEWRNLYLAAEAYSNTVAYPGQDFPLTADNARCVLCQQELDDTAQSRFKRFQLFMKDHTEATLQQARNLLRSLSQTLVQLSLPKVEDYADVLDALQSEERTALVTALTSIVGERDKLLQCVEKCQSPGETQTPLAATTFLLVLKDSFESQASEAEGDANPNGLKQLESSRDVLASRRTLNLLNSDISKFVADKGMEYKYDQCLNSLSTRSISDTSKEIISAALSPQLTTDLKQELQELGAAHLPLGVSITGRDGGARHQLILRNLARRAKLSEILSEGEHCVVAIAGFLAELGGTMTKSPIVLDDPVSSLDHRYIRHIAQRLVAEAKQRQVIVFTHNIAFLVEIEKLSAGGNLRVQTVHRSGGVAGYCMEGVPWEAMSVKDRLGQVDGMIVDVAKMHGANDTQYNREAAYIYDLLRQTWEAFIERELLYQTVQRHDTDVQTNRLMQVEILDSDCARIQAGMSKCSTWMAGHDKSVALDVNRPDPPELKHDVEELRSFVKIMNTRRTEVRMRRKEILEPKTPALG